MRWPRDFALIHPAWLMLVVIAVFAVQIGRGLDSPPDVRLTLFISQAAVVVPLLWAHGIYEVASAGQPRRWAGGLFVVAEAAIAVSLASLAAFDPLIDPLPMVLPAPVVVLYFAGLIVAASALTFADRADGRRASGILTFLLMVYFFIGAWFIRPRVQRLIEGS